MVQYGKNTNNIMNKTHREYYQDDIDVCANLVSIFVYMFIMYYRGGS